MTNAAATVVEDHHHPSKGVGLLRQHQRAAAKLVEALDELEEEAAQRVLGMGNKLAIDAERRQRFLHNGKFQQQRNGIGSVGWTYYQNLFEYQAENGIDGREHRPLEMTDSEYDYLHDCWNNKTSPRGLYRDAL
eukprot:8434083-Pyramimonas_sp.AAC.1